MAGLGPPGCETDDDAGPPPSFIDLFSGCGGLSLGLMKAGWRGLLAVERDPMAFETLKHNLLDGSLRGLPSFHWPGWFPKEPRSAASFARNFADAIREHLRGQVDLIAGGPPCQSFSFAGGRSPTDPRNTLWRDYLEVVDLIDAPLVLLENVHGISIEFGREKARSSPPRPGRKREPYSLRIQRGLEKRGYTVQQDLVLAADFGLPQLRPRHLMIGFKPAVVKESHVEFFEWLRAAREEFVSSKGLPCSRYVGMREAISDLKESHGTYERAESPRFLYGISSGPGTAYQRLLSAGTGRHRPDSHRFANHLDATTARFARMLKECRRGVNVREDALIAYGTRKHSFVVSDPKQPSHTLTTIPDDILHYSEPRILTVREYARLQSFPDSFQFRGKYTTGGQLRRQQTPRYSQVGNAVPPLLAEALGGVLIELVRGSEQRERVTESSLIRTTYNVLQSVTEGAKQSQPMGTPTA